MARIVPNITVELDEDIPGVPNHCRQKFSLEVNGEIAQFDHTGYKYDLSLSDPDVLAELLTQRAKDEYD
jgi:hypothetical protein